MSERIARSYLYVPGDVERRLVLADTRGADAVLADLEDAVSPDRKPVARHNVRDWLSVAPPHRAERWVRLNSGHVGLEDLRQVYGPGLRGVCLPKVASSADVEAVANLLLELEAAGPDRVPVAIMALIESAAGLLALPEISRAPRVQRLQLGEIDLAADLGVEPGHDELELLSARSAVVTASAASRLLPPLGPVSADVRDLVLLAESTRRLRRLGFFGRTAVHPDQIPVIHAVFDVTQDEVAQARQVLEASAAARATGAGVLLDDRGVMIDEATLRRSRRVLELARIEKEEQ